MCPVSADSIAIRAVSASRISPTMITSGSARRIERSPVANVEPGLAVDADLGDAVDPVLDRILDRDDVSSRRRDLAERRVERRRLTGAGRAGDQHRAVGLAAIEDWKRRPAVALHAELVERAERLLLVEDPDRCALAALGRQRDDPEVDLAALDVDARRGRPGGPASRRCRARS